MSRKAAYDWFLSDRGKRFAFLCASSATTLMAFGHIGLNTFLVSKYRDAVRLYSKGFSVPVPEKIQERFSKTLDLLEIDLYARSDFRPFMTAGFDVFSMGTFGRFHIHVAIPVNFTYNKVEDIDQAKIKVNLESVVWESDAGKQLLDAMVLSENAQMYVMAREIKLRSTYKLFFDTFFAAGTCLSTYGFSRFLNMNFDLYSKPRLLRFIGYSLVLVLNIGLYTMSKDVTQNYYEQTIDQELKEKSTVFAEGGKEFYTKILERNKALRVLMGRSGEKTYSVLGNENYYLRNKHMPLVRRKQLFEDKPKPVEKPLEVTEKISS